MGKAGVNHDTLGREGKGQKISRGIRNDAIGERGICDNMIWPSSVRSFIRYILYARDQSVTD